MTTRSTEEITIKGYVYFCVVMDMAGLGINVLAKFDTWNIKKKDTWNTSNLTGLYYPYHKNNNNLKAFEHANLQVHFGEFLI